MKKRVLSCFLSFLLLFSLPIAVPVTAESVNDDLCVMSYNRGSHTASDVAVLVQQYQPDTFGLQEDHADFLQDLSALLGNSYAYVGTASKGNGVGEHCAVFYQTECFDLVDSGTRWLSETPNEVSKGNDTSQDQARILTYALLKRKSDGQCVLHLNTHLDNKGGWLEQIGYVFDFLNEYNSEYPVVMTGDFNRDPSSEAYANIIAKGFSDSRMIARTVTDELGYTIRTTVTNSSGEEELVQQRIDFAFVKGVSHVAAYQLHTDGIEDDHFPVLVTYGLALRGEVDEGFENTNNTAYTPGYVLHHMDFAQIVSLEQTKYLFEVETTANGGSADNNFVLRNSDYEGQTDQKVLFYDYQRNGKNASHGRTWFLGNEIPTDLGSYTVEIQFRVTYFADVNNYFCFTWGNQQNDGTVTKSGDVGLRFKASIDSATATYSQGSTQAALASAIQGGEWVTYRIIVDDQGAITAFVSCNGQSASFATNKNASGATCIGMLQGNGTKTEVAKISVIAGTPTDYAESDVLWPDTENALVQALGTYAKANVLYNDSQELYRGYFQQANNNTAFRILLVGNEIAFPENESLVICFTYTDADSVKRSKTFTVPTDELLRFAAIEAAGELYVAASGQAIFGAVITDIPTDVTLNTVSVSFGEGYTKSCNLN